MSPKGYPRTTASMPAAGYGTWSAGWLIDEPGGSLVAVFGDRSLTAAVAPTYSNARSKKT